MNIRNRAGPLIGLAVTGPNDVKDLFEALAVLCPTLHDLNAVEVTGRWIFGGPKDKRRSFSCARGGRQVAAHRHAVCVAGLNPILAVDNFRRVLPAAEETHFDVRTADAKSFPAVQRVENRSARILLRPHTGQPAGAFGAGIEHAANEVA